MTLFDYDERGEFVRWGVAAAMVLAAHFGLGASYLLLRNTDATGMPQAPAVIIDLAPLPVSPASELDIAPGPQMQESLVRPEPKPEEKVEERPPPTENPVVALPESKPKVEPKPDKKPPAPRTTAAPRSPTQTANVAAAPAPGSNSANSFPPSWVSLLFSHLLRYRQYPRLAQERREEGVVTLSFTMDRSGRILSRSIARSSGYAALDAEALAMIDRAQPLPAFPPNIPETERTFTAPIKFSLR